MIEIDSSLSLQSEGSSFRFCLDWPPLLTGFCGPPPVSVDAKSTESSPDEGPSKGIVEVKFVWLLDLTPPTVAAMNVSAEGKTTLCQYFGGLALFPLATGMEARDASSGGVSIGGVANCGGHENGVGRNTR